MVQEMTPAGLGHCQGDITRSSQYGRTKSGRKKNGGLPLMQMVVRKMRNMLDVALLDQAHSLVMASLGGRRAAVM